MKTKTFLPILLTMLMSIVGVNLFAHDIAVTYSDGVTIYYIWQNNNTELAVSYGGSSYDSYWNEYTGNVVIPESVTYNGNSYPVTSIGNYAFSSCSGLTSVTIPNSVTSIGYSAFSNCSGLTSVTIPNSVTRIGTGAFYYCSGLTSVTIPNSVTTIGNEAFRGCSSLTSVTIPNSVTSIENYAFSGCSLNSVTIGSGVLSIGTGAFYTPKKTIWLTNTPPSGYSYAAGTVNYVANDFYTSLSNKTVYPFLSSLFEVDGVKYVPVSPSDRTCDAIDCLYDDGAENIHVGKTVTNQGITLTVKQVHPYAFYDNDYIKNVDLSFNGNVGNYAFYGCSALTKATINHVGTIGDYAFNSCTSMETATIGEEIPFIGSYAFSGCSSLKGIVIPNAVKTLGQNAFENCSSMTSVKLGTGVKSIEYSTFSGCSSLPDIAIPRAVTDIKNNVFNNCSGLKIVIMEDREAVLNLGSNGSSPLFSSCPLDSVYIGGNINYSTSSSYGYSPFYRNTSLRSVVITDKETEISENEFYGCTNLKNVSIGDGVESIGNWAFSGCSSLDYFAFGTALKTIGKEAFSDCTAVTRIISHAATPPTCGSQALDDINKWTCTLQVPLGGVDAYKAADQWKEFFFIQEENGDDLWFKLTYMVDGEEYKTYNLQYGTAITPEPEPTKYGYTFSGWSLIPETMPARDVTVSGTFTKDEDDPDHPAVNKLTMKDLSTNKDTQVILPIALENEKAITGFQFDLYLPTGVTVATNNKGKILVTTTDRMDGDYTITGNQTDGCIRIVGYSVDGYAFSGSDGDILNITLNIGTNVADGDYTVSLKDIVLSDVSNKEYHPADVSATLSVKSFTLGDVDNSGAININDVVCIINYILKKSNGTFIEEAADVDGSGSININDVVTLINRYILKRNNAPAKMRAPMKAVVDDNYLYLETIDINPGETKEISLLMTNADEVKAVQGNIKLPKGLSFVKKGNGRLDVSNNNARAEDFTLSCALQDDGSMTFAHYSADGFAYDGNSGGIFTFKIQAASDATPNRYEVKLSEMVLSIGGVAYEENDRTSVLNVTGTNGLSSINRETITNNRYYNLNGQRIIMPKKGVYILNGKKYVVK